MERSATGSYRELIAWQKGMCLVEAVYRFARTLPTHERFGIVAQLQRAYAQHVSIALGSQSEVETLLELTARLNIGETRFREDAVTCASEAGRLMYGLFRRLNERC